jgi:hypothetical protein
LIFNKGSKNIHWRKESFFNKGCWFLFICRRKKLDLFHHIPKKNLPKMDTRLKS